MVSNGEEHEEYLDRKDRADIKISPFQYGMSVLGAPLHAFLPAKWTEKRTLVMAGMHGEEPQHMQYPMLCAL